MSGKRYSVEFRDQAVKRVEAGEYIAAVARDIGIPKERLRSWYRKAGGLPRYGTAGRKNSAYAPYKSVSACEAAWVAGALCTGLRLYPTPGHGTPRPFASWTRGLSRDPHSPLIVARIVETLGFGSRSRCAGKMRLQVTGFQDVARLQEIIIPYAPELAPAFAELWAKFTPADMENDHEAP